MICAKARSQLSAYYDNELDPCARAEVAAHLIECAACRADLRQMSDVSEILHAGRACELPVGLWDRIAAAAPRRRPPVVLRWFVRAGAAAAGIAIYLLAHEAATPLVTGAAPRSTPVVPVEALLQDTASALSGRGLHDEGLVALARRPELSLLQEFTEDAHP